MWGARMTSCVVLLTKKVIKHNKFIKFVLLFTVVCNHKEYKCQIKKLVQSVDNIYNIRY